MNMIKRSMLSAATAMVAMGLASAFAQPGFSPLDRSNPSASGQDGNLRPHPLPPLATAVDKLPLDKIKLPSGFKAELWSSGHAGGRTMVMGDKGTMFMGTRAARVSLADLEEAESSPDEKALRDDPGLIQVPMLVASQFARPARWAGDARRWWWIVLAFAVARIGSVDAAARRNRATLA